MGGGLFVLKDDDADGAFTSPGENVQVTSGSNFDPVRVDRAAGTIYIMTRTEIASTPE